MSMSSAFRRTAQRLSVDWSAPAFKGDHELSAMVAGFRAWTAQANTMAEKYAGPPAPPDFAAAKTLCRDELLVVQLENMYATSSPPPQTHEWSADDRAHKATLIEEAKAELAFTQEMIDDTEREIEFLRAHRTTRDVSTNDMKEVYPDIAEEVETEIENREWFKDTLAK